MRRISIEGLVEQADSGIAIGGLAVGEEKNAMFDTIDFCDSLLPKDRPRYLMGVGKPTDIVRAIRLGVDMFDCVMPTRNGRNGQIFTSDGTVNITNRKYKNDHSPIDENSTHAYGRMFTKSYVRHLFNVKEILGLRIASTLNISYYISLTKKIQETIQLGEFDAWSNSWLSDMKSKKGM
jgi:queuine tRNA-ribosyltransferase